MNGKKKIEEEVLDYLIDSKFKIEIIDVNFLPRKVGLDASFKLQKIDKKIIAKPLKLKMKNKKLEFKNKKKEEEFEEGRSGIYKSISK